MGQRRRHFLIGYNDKQQKARASGPFSFHPSIYLACRRKANDQAGDGVDEQELVVDAYPALVATRLCQAVTAIVAAVDEMTTLCWREALTAIPTVLLDDDLFGGRVTLDGYTAMTIVVAALCLGHWSSKNSCGQKNGDELFHECFLSCFDKENLRINE